MYGRQERKYLPGNVEPINALTLFAAEPNPMFTNKCIRNKELYINVISLIWGRKSFLKKSIFLIFIN